MRDKIGRQAWTVNHGFAIYGIPLMPSPRLREAGLRADHRAGDDLEPARVLLLFKKAVVTSFPHEPVS
jgi:hypothetical protein